MSTELNGRTVAILATDGVEQIELTEPMEALTSAGATVHLISDVDTVQGYNHLTQGDTFDVDISLSSADPKNYDALMLPGGVANPDALRMDPDAVGFVKAFFDDDRPVAAICHAPWTMIEAGVLRGRTITSWPSLQTDVRNAGATWVDEEVHVDGRLVTSRKPDDLKAFCSTMVDTFAEAAR
jgi:protease I